MYPLFLCLENSGFTTNAAGQPVVYPLVVGINIAGKKMRSRLVSCASHETFLRGEYRETYPANLHHPGVLTEGKGFFVVQFSLCIAEA